jgi:putative resolvase
MIVSCSGIEGKIENLAVASKDRLTRFGFELIEDIIKTYSNGTITILHKKKMLNQKKS